MTEAWWLACTDPRLMLEFLRYKASERKLRLFIADGARVLALVFGHADIRGRWAVVSLSQFGGDGEDKLVERAVKTAVHELGHTLGLGHHDANPQCVMFFSEKLADTDRKSRDFCRACADSAKPTLSRLRT